MAEITCTDLGNTGEMTCPFLMKIIRRIILVPKFGSDGTANKLAVSGLTKAALQALFAESEPLDRYYPLPIVDNVTDERAEPTYFEWESGDQTFIKENARAFSGMIKRLTPELVGRINQWTGQEVGFYAFDADGNFIYSAAPDGSTDIYPIYIDGESIHAGLIKATNSDPLMGAVKFSTLQGVKDEDLRWIKATDLDFDGLSKVDVYGLQQVTVTISAATATSATFTVTLDQGVPLSGLAKTDIVATNLTTPGTITVATLTESLITQGTYVAAYSSGLATGETLKIMISKAKIAFGYDEFVATA